MITIEEKLIFRNVKKAAIVWLLALRIDPKPLTESEASEILQIDKETARKYLRTLSETQILTRLGRFEGYILTQSGKQLALPLELSRLASAEFPRSDPFNVNDSFNDLNDLNTSLTLIKAERGNPALERGNSALETPDTNPVEKSGDNLGDPVEKSIDQLIDELLLDQPEKKLILDELLNCRISMNWKTIALLYSDNITSEEIRSQYHQLTKTKNENNTGILITNLLAKYKPRGADFDPETGHPAECTCYKCIGARNNRFFDDFGMGNADLKKYREWED